MSTQLDLDDVAATSELAKKQLDELRAENQRLCNALEPSAYTKAAYSGEFKFPVQIEDELLQSVTVPWTTVKEIMKAIKKQANAKMTHCTESQRLSEALEKIMSLAGHPSATEACRLIIKEARTALGKE
jgi:hypothetical protein